MFWDPQPSLKGGRVFPIAISESLSSKWIAKAPAREVEWRKEPLDESRGMKPWIAYMISFTQLRLHEQHRSSRGQATSAIFGSILYLRDLFPFLEQTNVGYMLSLRGIPQLSIRRNASFPRETNSSDITHYFDAR